MLKRVMDYDGYLLHLPAHPTTTEAILFLHGLPANKYLKNLDLAIETHKNLNNDVFLRHYSGLGEAPGEFLFTRSVFETIELIKWLVEVKKYKNINLVGHSWGGLVAVNCASALPEKIKSILLLSPFCFTSQKESLYKWFIEDIRKDCPGIFGKQSPDVIASDFNQILNSHLPLNLAEKIDKNIKIRIIQSKNDDVTPSATTKMFAQKLQGQHKYIELDQDHGFLQSREELVKEIQRMLLEDTK